MEVFLNNKNGKQYYRIRSCINKTNDQDGQKMIEYRDYDGNYYVKEEREFNKKFTQLT